MSTSSIIQTSVASGDNTSTTDNSLSRWIFERVKEFISGRVLEVSNGRGHIAAYCTQNGVPTEVFPITLNDDSHNIKYSNLIGVFDTLIVLNTAHQILNYRQAIAGYAQMLKYEGHIIIQMPACTALYNGLDQGFRRWKLYNMEFMNNILRTHFRIVKTRYFMIADQQPPPSLGAGKYQERVTVFKTGNAVGIDEPGLFAIVICKKRQH